ncbi:hypothetical protein [Deinococcus enclensis]|uniref:Uncharacterized protein n=1 Tax=Deinococcus enclensis TaxID=1049582 RepID=A0ABT9MF82_9DEIO|nr:hypothetical protein [Deinococcus enclensis]MDP9765248.1 hypothetical protein [Deinococcus enclensis]
MILHFRAGDTVRLARPGDTQAEFDAIGTVQEDSHPRTRQTRVSWHAAPEFSQWLDTRDLQRTSPGGVPALLAAMIRTEQATRARRR